MIICGNSFFLRSFDKIYFTYLVLKLRLSYNLLTKCTFCYDFLMKLMFFLRSFDKIHNFLMIVWWNLHCEKSWNLSSGCGEKKWILSVFHGKNLQNVWTCHPKSSRNSQGGSRELIVSKCNIFWKTWNFLDGSLLPIMFFWTKLKKFQYKSCHSVLKFKPWIWNASKLLKLPYLLI